MTLQEFKTTLTESKPPRFSNNLLTALWHDANGNWIAAHNVAQDEHSAEGSWVHAYLHRKEGDNGNAAYWYNRAKRTLPSISLADEWEEIVKALL
jgi:hypothetical protein